MSNVDTLLKRIDAEFSALKDKIKTAQSEQLQEHQERQKRLARFEQQLADLPAVWKPRLEALVQRFGDRVKVTPQVTSSSRGATFEFQSELARIRLQLSASTDRDVRKLILDYNLEIIPIFMKFDSHQQSEWPLDAIDKQAVANWIDDRIVSFVQTYLSLHENQYYLKDHMVEDPIAGTQFPRYAAATTLERDGKTIYFISNETRREFEAKHGIAPK
jgi:YHS domain-containing protein/FtsZ-binding cell division protein ZapB